MRTYLFLTAAALTAAPSLPAYAADEALSFRGGLTWTNAFQLSQAVEDPRNPDNAVLRIPENAFISQLKPNMKIVGGPLQLVARPQVTWTYSKIDERREADRAEVDALFTEAFLQWAVSDSVTFAYGKHSYQWGAAEALSPSNRIFHETVEARNLLYDVRGRHMARLNLTLGKSFSAVVMSEVEADAKNPEVFRAEETFTPTTLAKLEVSWNDGADYLGLVGGARETGDAPWYGEYVNFSLPFIEGISLYGDASHQRGSDAWYPKAGVVDTPVGPQEVVTFEQTKKDIQKVYTLAVGGLRYDFEGGTTVRAEYVLNEAGYGKHDSELEKKAFARTAQPWQLAHFEQNVARSLRPGVDLRGKRYVLASLLLPHAADVQDLRIYLRALQSLADRSLSGYMSVEYAVGDAGAALASVSGTRGDSGDELRGFASPTYLAGYKHQW